MVLNEVYRSADAAHWWNKVLATWDLGRCQVHGKCSISGGSLPLIMKTPRFGWLGDDANVNLFTSHSVWKSCPRRNRVPWSLISFLTSSCMLGSLSLCLSVSLSFFCQSFFQFFLVYLFSFSLHLSFLPFFLPPSLLYVLFNCFSLLVHSLTYFPFLFLLLLSLLHFISSISFFFQHLLGQCFVLITKGKQKSHTCPCMKNFVSSQEAWGPKGKEERKGRVRESEVEPPGSLNRPGLAQTSSTPFLEASSAEFSL